MTLARYSAYWMDGRRRDASCWVVVHASHASESAVAVGIQGAGGLGFGSGSSGGGDACSTLSYDSFKLQRKWELDIEFADRLSNTVL